MKKITYKELLTLLITSTAFVFTHNFITEYKPEYENFSLIGLLLFSIISNHIVFKIERKQNNTYFGRVIITFLFFLFVAIYQLLVNNVNVFRLEALLILGIFTLVIELILHPITRLFPKLYKNLTSIKLISALILGLVFFSINYNYQKETYTYWKKLTWDDFKYKPNKNTSHDAGMVLDIVIEFDKEKNKYISKAVSINELSFKKKMFTKQFDLLKHEQYHFDMTELYATKMNKFLNKKNINSKFDYIFKLSEIRKTNDDMQQVYDIETNHGLNDEEQIRWERKIDSMKNRFDF